MPTAIIDRLFSSKREFRLAQVRCKKELHNLSPFKAGDRVLREGWITPRTILEVNCYATLTLDLQTDPNKRIFTCYDWGNLHILKPEDEFGPLV